MTDHQSLHEEPRTVCVKVYEIGPSGRHHHHTFYAVSAHRMKMTSLLETDGFEGKDGVSALVFIRTDGAAVGSFFEGGEAARTLAAFNEALVSGRVFCLTQERR